MRNFQGIFFNEYNRMGRFSNLHWCIFKYIAIAKTTLESQETKNLGVTDKSDARGCQLPR